MITYIQKEEVIFDLSSWRPCKNQRETSTVNGDCLSHISVPAGQIYHNMHKFYNQQENLPKQLKLCHIFGSEQPEIIEKYWQTHKSGQPGNQTNLYQSITYLIRNLPKQEDPRFLDVQQTIFQRYDEIKGMEESSSAEAKEIQNLPEGFNPEWLLTYRKYCQNRVLRGTLGLVFTKVNGILGVKRFQEISNIKIKMDNEPLDDNDKHYNWAFFKDDSIEIQIWMDKNRKKEMTQTGKVYDKPREVYIVDDPDDVCALNISKNHSKNGFLLETTNGQQVTDFATPILAYAKLIRNLRRAAEQGPDFETKKKYFNPRTIRHTINGALGQSLAKIVNKEERDRLSQLAYTRTGHTRSTMINTYLTENSVPDKNVQRILVSSTPTKKSESNLNGKRKRQDSCSIVDDQDDSVSNGVVVIDDTIHIYKKGKFTLVIH